MEKNIRDSARTLKKIVVIGPESTGKSSLSAALAAYYNTQWVPEFARSYIDQLTRPYEEHDLLEIAKGQISTEEKKARQAHKLLICDTDLIVIKIWYEYKYGYCPMEILAEIDNRSYDLYLLTDVDIPWKYDPQREHPHLREHFMNIFNNELEQYQVPYVKISGNFEERKNTAIKAIDRMF